MNESDHREKVCRRTILDLVDGEHKEAPVRPRLNIERFERVGQRRLLFFPALGEFDPTELAGQLIGSLREGASRKRSKASLSLWGVDATSLFALSIPRRRMVVRRSSREASAESTIPPDLCA
jgi:hypothetical protein